MLQGVAVCFRECVAENVLLYVPAVSNRYAKCCKWSDFFRDFVRKGSFGRVSLSITNVQLHFTKPSLSREIVLKRAFFAWQWEASPQLQPAQWFAVPLPSRLPTPFFVSSMFVVQLLPGCMKCQIATDAFGISEMRECANSIVRSILGIFGPFDFLVLRGPYIYMYIYV